MQRDPGGKGQARLQAARLVEEPERDEAARHRVRLVDEVLEPRPLIGCPRRSDVEPTLDEAVRKLRQAVPEPQRKTEQPGIGPVVVEWRQSSQACAVSRGHCLSAGDQRRERGHDDHSAPGLASAEHRFSTPLQPPIDGDREAGEQPGLQDDDLAEACQKDWGDDPGRRNTTATKSKNPAHPISSPRREGAVWTVTSGESSGNVDARGASQPAATERQMGLPT